MNPPIHCPSPVHCPCTPANPSMPANELFHHLPCILTGQKMRNPCPFPNLLYLCPHETSVVSGWAVYSHFGCCNNKLDDKEPPEFFITMNIFSTSSHTFYSLLALHHAMSPLRYRTRKICCCCALWCSSCYCSCPKARLGSRPLDCRFE